MGQVEVLAGVEGWSWRRETETEEEREREKVIIFTSGRSRKQRTRRLLDSFENSPKNRSFFFFSFFFPSLPTAFLGKNRSRF